MAENFCGKSCETCTFKEQLSCNGCKAGPGSTFSGDCGIAKCCRERGHDTCATCNQKAWCGKHSSAETMADIRLQKQLRELAKRKELEKHISTLAKSLTLIFWLSIASLIPGLMSNSLTVVFPGLYTTGQVLMFLFSLTITVVYFRLGRVNRRYRKAALCMGVSVVATFVQGLITGGETPPWTLLISIPTAVLGLLWRYNQYTAHSEVLVPVNYDLSEKWMQLWKWYIRLGVTMIAAVLLTVIFPILGAIVMVVVAIGSIVISIMELIYFYRMMICLRTYARKMAD